MKIPIPKIRLKAILATLLVAAMVWEVLVLYKSLFERVDVPPASGEEASQKTTDFNVQTLRDIDRQILNKLEFNLDVYDLTATSSGRENPLADY